MPKPVQPFLTWLTAKPLPEDLEREGKRTPFHHVVISASLIVAGILLSAFGYVYGLYAVLGLGFVLATGGLKQMQVMICHNCAHNMIFQSREANVRVGTFISGLFLLKPFEIYKKEHLLHHDHKTLLTDDDDTLSFLQSVVGLKPSDSVKVMWLKLVTRAFSPLVIARSCWQRLVATSTAPNRTVAWLTLAFWATITVAALWSGHFDIFLVAWALPIFAGFHISSTFRLAAEHTWPSVEVLEKRGIEFISDSTTGVFIGEELVLPADANLVSRTLRTAIWSVKMMTFHLFIRVFVMVGDTPCHDFHHRRPKSREWPNYIQARERDKNGGSKPYPTNYVDYWGYITAVTTNFRNFQNARPYYDNKLAT